MAARLDDGNVGNVVRLPAWRRLLLGRRRISPPWKSKVLCGRWEARAACFQVGMGRPLRFPGPASLVDVWNAGNIGTVGNVGLQPRWLARTQSVDHR